MTEQMTVVLENAPSADALSHDLINTEIGLELKSLTYRDTGERKYTSAVFDVRPDGTNANEPRLVEDPTGNAAPNAGEKRVCTGTAAINGRSRKVAVFRKE